MHPATLPPGSVAGAEGVVWSSGFLVPGKQAGQLQLYDTSDAAGSVMGPYNIASLDTVRIVFITDSIVLYREDALEEAEGKSERGVLKDNEGYS